MQTSTDIVERTEVEFAVDDERAPCYTDDNHSQILSSIPGIGTILTQVAELKAHFESVSEQSTSLTTGQYQEDQHLQGPDPKDKNTPDKWVPRNQWMNRLTGTHPFNVEAPVSLLKKHGFLTPQTVHYVRNHGLVPRLSWHSHRIDISGLVDRPMSISMAELVSLPTVTVPVTLNCAGNRRKEQNLIEKGIGFHWGCAAASTSIWTGVPLRALLEHIGVQDEAQWLNFAGPVGEVDLGDETYGASHAKTVCNNPTRPCMLAFMINGELLHPDHGYPVRLLMPGYIGGRMIKWLTKINLSVTEASNHYHVYDNRVFPKYITSREEATKHKVWTDPAYVINDRNLNSAIWSPAHCEKIPLTESTYRVGGYAYNGAGRPVQRVEVTLNDGHNWMPATITRFEQPNEYGMTWCWVHWHVDIPTSQLAECTEFAVAAWDDSINRQPELPSWNLMGMMNNNWFRVKVHAVPGEDAIWCEHPTRVERKMDADQYWDASHGDNSSRIHMNADGTSLASPGWMERLKEMVVDAYKPLPLEEQPRDGSEYAERCLKLKTFKGPIVGQQDQPSRM